MEQQQDRLFDPESVEPYTLADITPEEQYTLRMRMPSYFPPLPEISDPGDECKCEECQ